MKKIYIGRSVIEMNTEAAEKLQTYLDELKQALLKSEEEVEIFEDIESRIEERLLIIKQTRPISEADIDTICLEIGKPEEIFTSESEKTQSSSPIWPVYRNASEWKFLWVCSGLGKALHIEPIWIRIIFIISALGTFFTSIIFYVVLALIMPEEPQSIYKKGTIWKKANGLQGVLQRFFQMLHNFGESIIQSLK